MANPPVVDRGATEEELGGSDENQVLDVDYTPEGIEPAIDNTVDEDAVAAAIARPADDPNQALLTPGAFARWVAQTYCDEVEARVQQHDHETLVRELLDLSNEKVLWANDLRRPPYQKLKPFVTISVGQKKVLEKALDVTIDDQLLMKVTSVVEDDELPAQLSVSERDEEAGAEAAEKLAAGKADYRAVVSFIQKHYDYGVTPDGETFAVPKSAKLAKVAQSIEALRRPVLSTLFDNDVDVTPEAMNRALEVIEAKASAQEPERLALRSHQVGTTSITVDLGDKAGTMVHITADGWQVVTPGDPEVAGIRWQRSRGCEVLPEPERGGTRDELADHLGLDPDGWQWRLSYGWLVASVFADFYRPLLWNVGIMGSAKSSRAKTLLRLVDPRRRLGSTWSGDTKSDASVARARFVPSYDNVRDITTGMSNFICVMVTGGEHSGRKLYTDGDVHSMDFTRTAVATSVIKPYGLGPDAVERIVFVDYERMTDGQRRTDGELEADFLAKRARFLGALYDDVAAVLRHYETAKARMVEKPRMADYSVALGALDVHLGLPLQGGYLSTFWENSKEASATQALSNPLVVAMAGLVPKSGNQWKGSASDLLLAVAPKRPTDQRAPWPKAPNSMAAAVNENAETMRSIGVEVRHERVTVEGVRVKQIVLRNVTSRMDAGDETAEDRAELLALARAHADGYRGHLVELADRTTGVEVHDRGDGFSIVEGGVLDVSPWDPDTRCYNGAPARAWLEVDDRFKVL